MLIGKQVVAWAGPATRVADRCHEGAVVSGDVLLGNLPLAAGLASVGSYTGLLAGRSVLTCGAEGPGRRGPRGRNPAGASPPLLGEFWVHCGGNET